MDDGLGEALIIILAVMVGVTWLVILVGAMPAPTNDDISMLKEQNYAKCLDVCLYDSNETLVKVSKAYCVQQCNR